MLVLFCVFILFQVIDKAHQCHDCCCLSRDVENGITCSGACGKCQLVYCVHVVCSWCLLVFYSDWWSGCFVDII